VADCPSIGGLAHAIGWVALAVLIERDLRFCRLLVSFVFGEIGDSPAHHSGVEDTQTPEPIWRASNRLNI
jgi:hypothetical protein